MLRKVWGSLSLVLVMVLGVGGVANAAYAHRDTSISGWFTGVSSNTWYDPNGDSLPTIIELYGCHHGDNGQQGWPAATWGTLRLKRADAGPDTDYGAKGIPCTLTTRGSKSWSVNGAYNFYFTLVNYTNTDYKFYAKDVDIYW
jgi:hypothetical protein